MSPNVRFGFRLRQGWHHCLTHCLLREWGCKPLFVREGGTMPVARLLEEMLGAPAIMIPMGQASDAPHLANERIRRTNLFRGKNVIRRLLEELMASLRAEDNDLVHLGLDV
jgi:acetylornithine deacetylase/succinyl-diaminopimelate desuccinylase-like protein